VKREKGARPPGAFKPLPRANDSPRLSETSGNYVFSVAQIFNLPYGRFVVGRTLLAGDIRQVKNLRYSRLQVCAAGAASTLNIYSGKAGGES